MQTDHFAETARGGVNLISSDEVVPWYALRLFDRNLTRVTSYLDSRQLSYFVPMQYRERLDKDGRLRRHLVPVVSNLLFLKKTEEEQQMLHILDNSQCHLQVMRKERGSSQLCEIPAHEMREFIYICDPDKVLFQLLTTEEAAMKTGTKVLVTHGPLKGFTGTLVRHSRQHYLLRGYTGFAVMAKVTKWCCRPLTDNAENNHTA